MNFSINNFRVFNEEQEFNFAPITVLVGKNNSGKSTLVRSIQLFHENFKKKNQINRLSEFEISELIPSLGNFNKIITKKSLNKYIVYKFKFRMIGIDEELYIQFNIKQKQKQPSKGYFKSISINRLNKQKLINIDFNSTTGIETYYFDTSFFLEQYKKECEKKFHKKETDTFFDKFIFENESISEKDIFYDLSHVFKNLSHLNIKRLEFLDFSNHFLLRIENNYRSLKSDEINYLAKDENFDNDTYLEVLKSHNEFIITNNKNIFGFLDKLLCFHFLIDGDFDGGKLKKEIYELYPGIERRIDYESGYYVDTFNDISELIKSKLITKYTYLQKIDNFNRQRLNFDEIGKESFKKFKKSPEYKKYENHIYFSYITKNRIEFFLAVFVNNNLKISLINSFVSQIENCHFISLNRNELKRSYFKDNFSNLIYEVLSEHVIYEKYINKYLKLFEIGDSLEIERDNEGEYLRIYINKNKDKILLADLGFGVAQILPILFKIVLVASKKCLSNIIFIEEPESNLHPGLQSKLADMFFDAANSFQIKFVLETHSEYLIRRMQYLTSNGTMAPKDSIIYYFYHPNEIPENEKQIKEIHINEDGTLTDAFGTGFFDEADNLAMNLFMSNNPEF